jgi:hypothetical protein
MNGDDVLRALEAGSPHDAIRHARGTLRIDVVDDGVTEQRFVTMHDGNVTVTESDAPADAILCGERELMNAVLSGSKDAMTAVLRGDMIAEGDLVLLAMFQRLVPGAPGAVAPSTSS